MSIFSSKKFLIPLVSVAGVGTVAIGTGVGIAVNQQKASEETNKTETVNWTELTPASINLQKVVEGIDQKDIAIFAKKNSEDNSVIKRKSLVETNSKLERTNTYAFDVAKDQLALDEVKKTSIPTGVEISFELDTQTNNSVSLNEGKLAIIIKAKQGNNSAEKKITLEDLKKVEGTLKTLVETKETKVLLDLSKKQAEKSDAIYRTIEDLNKVSEVKQPKAVPLPLVSTSDHHASSITLHESEVTEKTNQSKSESVISTLLKTLIGDSSSANTTTYIQGKVKVEKIQKETDNKTYFYLTSANKNETLRLIDTKENGGSIALVDKIKISNLLASEIKLTPTANINQEETTKYHSVLSQKGFTKDSSLNKLSFKVDGNEQTNINLDPYIIDKITKDQEIKVDLEISFGVNETKTTFSTKDETQLKMLQESGFSFGIYSRTLEDGDNTKELEASKLKNGTYMLNKYFAKDNFTKPVDIKTLQGSSGSMPLGGFSLKTITAQEIKHELIVGKAIKSMPQDVQADTPEVKLLPENFLTFVSYTYGETKDKVLFTNGVELLHFEVKQPAIKK